MSYGITDEQKKEFKHIGEDVFIDITARIVRPNLVSIGTRVAIDMCVYISTELEVGDYSHIAPQVSIIGGAKSRLIMEHFTNIASGSRIVCGTDDFTKGLINPLVPQKYRYTNYSTVTFKRHSIVGVNCVVLPGITLAEGSVVGANSLLTKDTEPWTIYAGSPAKPIKMRDHTEVLKYEKEMGY